MKRTVGGVDVAFGQGAACVVEPDRALHRVRQLVEAVEDLGDLLGEHRAPHLGQVERHQVLRHHLRRERLRGGDADLGARVHVEHPVGLACQGRSHGVGHRDHLRPLAASVPGGLQRVDRLAALRHRQRQRVGAEDRIAIAELARDLDLDGQAGPVLDRVLRDHARVERRPAGHDEDLVHLAEHVVADVELIEHQPATDHPPHERVADRGGLLVDLLAHERVVAALLRLGDVPVHRDRLRVLRPVRRSR